MSQAKSGDSVRVHYTGKFADGEMFDSSVGKDSLQFVIGAGQLIAGFDRAPIRRQRSGGFIRASGNEALCGRTEFRISGDKPKKAVRIEQQSRHGSTWSRGNLRAERQSRQGQQTSLSRYPGHGQAVLSRVRQAGPRVGRCR
jgi:hypothetical protein